MLLLYFFSVNTGSIQYQQLTSKYLEGACEVTKKTVFTSGTMCRFLGVPEDEDALAELTQISRTAAKDGVSVIAIDKTTDKVVAVAINKFLVSPFPNGPLNSHFTCSKNRSRFLRTSEKHSRTRNLSK
jgi:ribulose bisphosphate carboxylase small subunit